MSLYYRLQTRIAELEKDQQRLDFLLSTGAAHTGFVSALRTRDEIDRYMETYNKMNVTTKQPSGSGDRIIPQ